MAKCGVSWCLLGLLSVIALLATNANAEQGPTVNECRVHVEAALKQYWTSSGGQSAAVPRSAQADEREKDEAEDPPVPADTDPETGSDGGDQGPTESEELAQDEPQEADNQTDDGSDDDDHDGPSEAGHEESDDDDERETGNATDDESEVKEGQEEANQEDESKSDENEDTKDGTEEAVAQGDSAPTEEVDDDSTDDDEATTEESVASEDATGAGVESELPESEPSSEQSQDQAEDASKDQEEEDDETDDKVTDNAEEESKDSEATEPATDDAQDTEGEGAQEAESEDAQEGDGSGSDTEDEEDQETGVAEQELGGDIDDDDEDEIPTKVLVIRTRQHIDDILGLDEIGTETDKDEDWLVTSTLKDLKKTYDQAIKPMEGLYKYRDVSNRVLGDAEVFGKPTVLFLGPWSSGKSSIINYLLGVERTPSALKTGPEPTDTKFTVVTYGEKNQVVSGTEMAADWPYSTVQKFGQGFLDHFRGIKMPHRLLQKVTLVDTPGIMETKKPQDKGYPFNEAFQWFIDRADAIYIVFDPTKLEIGNELEAVLDQLKGREAQIRFILNKADAIRRRDVMRITGQLFWNLSPMLGSSEAPVIYTVSLITKPFHPGSPAKFLMEQEKALLHDIKVTMDRRVENRISYARRHAVRVRNHAKMVDCYLATYFRHKSIFSNRKEVALSITENPNQYGIYAGLSALTNVSRYDLPDPEVYRDFFRLNPLYDFAPLSATCSYFKGCPLDKLDLAISYDLPELLGKYKKRTKIQPSEWDDEKGR